MLDDTGGDDFNPVEYYIQHRKVEDDAQLSEDEIATLEGMDRTDVDDLIDIDWRAWKLRRRHGQPPSTEDATDTADTIKRVGAVSY
ncbi:MAG TPA: hypothetical protein VE824_04555 [Gaiellales bacterium]|nr:hypothetical protein [Gaiellales bacterium]